MLYQTRIAFKLWLDCFNTLAHTVLAHTDIMKLIAENQYTASQFLHCLRYGRNGILDRPHQLLNCRFQLSEQSIVCLDLSVDFTPFRNNALFLQCTGNHTLVNGRLLGQAPICMAAVVDAFVVSILLQIAVGHICPRFAPLHKLFLAVPALGNGILSTKLGAFWIFVDTFIAVLLRFGWRQIYFLSSNLVRILFLPSVRLRRLELGGCKAPFLAISDAKIFFLGLVLPVTLFIKRAHCYHNVSMRIMTGRVRIVDRNIGAHSLGNKAVLNEIG